jgi:hypothetical protein
MAFLPIYYYFILLSFIVSLIVYPSIKQSYLKFFPPFLFATLVIEYIGSYVGSLGKNNLIIYNFFAVVEICFYLYLISLIITNKKAKNIIRIAALLYSVFSVINIVFIQGIKGFPTISYSLGCLIIVAACIYYFLELFRLPKSIKLTKNPAFWICSGLMFFYCCGFPLFAFLSLWMKIDWVINSFESIVAILNIFLYSLFTIALLCSKTKYTSSSSSG